MKKCISFLLIILFVFSIMSVLAQEYKKAGTRNPPPGMVFIEKNGVATPVPKDIQMRRMGNTTVTEGHWEYVSRKFLEIERYFARIETAQSQLKGELEGLRRSIQELKNSQAEEIEELKKAVEDLQKAKEVSGRKKTQK